MINSKSDLKRFINTETAKIREKSKLVKLFGWLPPLNCFGERYAIYKLLCYLRKAEYYHNTRSSLQVVYSLKLKAIQNKFCVRIPMNVFDEGLDIPHLGPIVVHNKCKIGKNCRIHVGVNIGAEKDRVPVIGDNCYIGPGAKILGGVVLGNDIKIGANAVVTHSFGDGTVLVGVPARAKGEL